jgi:hypothetical protein
MKSSESIEGVKIGFMTPLRRGETLLEIDLLRLDNGNTLLDIGLLRFDLLAEHGLLRFEIGRTLAELVVGTVCLQEFIVVLRGRFLQIGILRSGLVKTRIERGNFGGEDGVVVLELRVVFRERDIGDRDCSIFVGNGGHVARERGNFGGEGGVGFGECVFLGGKSGVIASEHNVLFGERVIALLESLCALIARCPIARASELGDTTESDDARTLLLFVMSPSTASS